MLGDYLGLAVLSYAAPLIANLIYLVYGVTYWGYPDRFPILPILGLCGFVAVPTLLVLLPFRKRRLDRWIMWAICIGFWTWLRIYMGP